MAITYNNSNYIIKGTFSLVGNIQGDPSLVSVTIGNNTTITAHDSRIPLGSDNNEQVWRISGKNKQLGLNQKYYIYIRCSTKTSDATLFLSVYQYDVWGVKVTQTTTEEDPTESTETTHSAYYIKIGEISAGDPRTIDYDLGMYGTTGGKQQSIMDMVTTAIQNLMSQIKSALSNVFLSKEKDDETTHKLTMAKSHVKGDAQTDGKARFKDTLTIRDYDVIGDEDTLLPMDLLVLDNLEKGVSGGGAYRDENGNIHVEADYLDVHRKLTAREAEILSVSYIGGTLVLTPANGFTVQKAPTNEGSVWKLCWKTKDADGNTHRNTWKEGDLAMCQEFGLDSNSDISTVASYSGGLNTTFWWREVTAVGTETDSNGVSWNYIKVSNVSGHYAASSDTPSLDNKVVHLGHIDEYEVDGETLTTECKRRQSAIMLDTAGTEKPSIRVFENINSYTLANKFNTQLMPGDNRLEGIVKITGGSIGNYNLSNLPTDISSAISKSVEAEAAVAALKFGNTNLLRNSGFTGDYTSITVAEGTSMSEDTEVYSPSLQHWDYNNATAVRNIDDANYFAASETGILCSLANGYIKQTLYYRITSDKYYFSFYGKKAAGSATASEITVKIGNIQILHVVLQDTWTRHSVLFDPEALDIVGGSQISIEGTGYIAQLQLEKGDVLTGWSMSVLDNGVEMAYYTKLLYLSECLGQNTAVVGGLVLSSLIELGHSPTEDADSAAYWQNWQNTAGINGVTDGEADDPAFWAGGDLTSAIEACSFYDRNGTSAIPTTTELASHAKAVITHNGRAILNDAVIRGGITAQSPTTNNRVEITPDGLAMRVYNAEGKKVAVYGGEKYTSVDTTLRTDGGMTETSTTIGAAHEFSQSSEVTLVSNRKFDECVLSAKLSVTPKGELAFYSYPKMEFSLVVEKIIEGGDNVVTEYGITDMAYALKEMSDSGLTAGAITCAFNVKILAGTYNMKLKCVRSAVTGTVEAQIKDAIIVKGQYVMRQYANALVMGSSTLNYASFGEDKDGLVFDVRNVKSRMLFDSKGMRYATSALSGLYPIPQLIACGMVETKSDGTCTYTSLLQSDVIAASSAARLSTGKASLKLQSTNVVLNYTNCMVTLTGYGNAKDASGNALTDCPIKASVAAFDENYLVIALSDDDSMNDGKCMLKIEYIPK